MDILLSLMQNSYGFLKISLEVSQGYLAFGKHPLPQAPSYTSSPVSPPLGVQLSPFILKSILMEKLGAPLCLFHR